MAAAGVLRRIRAQHAGKSVAAADFSTDQIAVGAERFAQRGDVEFDVFFHDDDTGPYPAEQLCFRDQRAIGFQKHHEDIEGARAEFGGNAVGEQLPPAQQNAETAEFEIRAGGRAVRGVSALRKWVSASRRLWTNIHGHSGFSRSG